MGPPHYLRQRALSRLLQGAVQGTSYRRKPRAARERASAGKVHDIPGPEA